MKKIKECLKTISGVHQFEEKRFTTLESSRESATSVFYYSCIFCGVVDDATRTIKTENFDNSGGDFN